MLVIKIGGGKRINVEGIINNISDLNADKILIIHGANALRDDLAKKINYEKRTITSLSGYESVYTDNDMIDLMLMSYSGLRNKRIVELLQQQGINAIGLTGIDGRMIEGKRNKGIKAKVGNKKKIIRDQSGKPKKINLELLTLLFENNYVPVLTVPIMDEIGKLVNTENDDIITTICKDWQGPIDEIIMFIGEKGLLSNYDDKESVIPRLDYNQLVDFEQKTLGRMKRKLLAIKKMLSYQDTTIRICDGRTENPITDVLDDKGTTIRKELR